MTGDGADDRQPTHVPVRPRSMEISRATRQVRRLLLVLGFALAPLLLAVAPAQACSCAMVSPEEHRERADVVVVGELLDIEPRGDHRFLLVGVEGVEKGEAGPRLTLATNSSGASCGLDFVTVGERYRFFATTSPSGLLSADLCGGTTGIGDAPPDPELAAAPGPGTTYDSFEDYRADYRADSARPHLPDSGDRLGLGQGIALVALATLVAGGFAVALHRHRHPHRHPHRGQRQR